MEERISLTSMLQVRTCFAFSRADGTFSWTSGVEDRKECLSGINLTVNSGELVAVVVCYLLFPFEDCSLAGRSRLRKILAYLCFVG